MNILFSLLIFALPAAAYPFTQPDTVIIQTGDGREIRIVSSAENELESLSELDLNAIIRDIQQQLHETQEQNVVILLEDSLGEKYTLQKDTADTDSLGLEQELEILSEKLEQLGDSLENIFERRGERQDSPVHFNKDSQRGTKTTMSFDLGLNNYLMNGKFPDESGSLYAVRPVYSWYIAVGGVNKTHVSGPLFLDWGANMSWYNFKFENTRTRLLKEEEGLFIFEDSLVSDPIKSKLSIPYLNISFVPVLNFGSRRRNDWLDYDNNAGFRIGFGAYAGYRLGGKTKYVFKEDGDRERVKNRTNFYVNNWRYGLRLQMGIGGFDFFANYDLNELFNEGKGPELNAFSFGLVF